MGQNTQKIFLEALNARKTDSVPFWFMRQAGRYLPEYRKLRAEKGGFLAMALDPEAACEITLQPIRRFGMDAAIIFSDILVVPMALGQKLSFEAGEGPKLEPMDFKNLDYKESILNPVFEALSRVREGLSREGFSNTALIGFAGGPWTVAAYMIQGSGSKDFAKAKAMAENDQGNFSALIDVLVDSTSCYLIKQVEAGAEALQIFESWAGLLDAHQFAKWVIAPTKKIIQNIRKIHPHIPIIGFPRLAGESYVAYAEETGVTAIGLDQTVSTSWAAQNLQTRIPVQGNLDPELLIGGGEAMEHATRSILKDLTKKPFVFNLGHGINKETPVEHVEQLVKIIRNFKP